MRISLCCTKGFGNMDPYSKLTGGGGVNHSNSTTVFPGSKKGTPVMTTRTFTARRKGDPQLCVEDRN